MATDNFNRADETPPAGWTQDSVKTAAVGISGNQITVPGFSTGVVSYGASSSTSCQFKIVANPNGCGPCIHWDDAGSGYFFATGGVIFRVDAGSVTFLASGLTPASAGDTAVLRRSVNDVVASVNGSDVGSATDTTYSGGRPAGWIDNLFSALDDFDDLAGGGGGPSSVPLLYGIDPQLHALMAA